MTGRRSCRLNQSRLRGRSVLRMPRPKSRPRYSVPVVESPAITPEMGLRVTLKQALFVAGGFLMAGGAYFSIVWTQTSTTTDIKRLETAVQLATRLTTDKAQEDTAARAKIRDDFIANQQKMAEVLAKLDTRLAVAETNQKSTIDQLGKIVDLLQRSAAQPPKGR